MSYRFMRIICFFDLPTVTAEDRKAYRNFRKMLINNGFFMMQESVYCKMVLNQTAQKYVIDTLRREKPARGIVQVLPVTEKQFSDMEYLVGKDNNCVIDTDERLVIL